VSNYFWSNKLQTIYSSIHVHHDHKFLLLLYVVKGSSSLNDREKQTIQIEFLNFARQTIPLSFQFVDEGQPPLPPPTPAT